MHSKQKTYTYSDYEKLPEGAPYQLIDGELVKSPSPTPLHQEIILKICRKFFPFQDNGLGKVLLSPIDVFLKETETYQPDLIFIRHENLSIIGEKKIEGSPDLVVEVLSPSTAYYDLRHKKEVYASEGVKEYWIVDPMEKSIEIYRNENGKFVCVASGKERGRIQSKLFPELTMSPAKLFGF